MKAVIVQNTFTTRVIVSDDATETELVERAKLKFRQTWTQDFSTSFENIKLDEEVPYDPVADAVKPYTLAPHLTVVK